MGHKYIKTQIHKFYVSDINFMFLCFYVFGGAPIYKKVRPTMNAVIPQSFNSHSIFIYAIGTATNMGEIVSGSTDLPCKGCTVWFRQAIQDVIHLL